MWTGSKQQIADMCGLMAGWYPMVIPGVETAQMWWAMAGVESSFGMNCTPRHEPAFDVGGVYGSGPIMKPLLAKFGRAAACSYGPWQLMFCNAPDYLAPADFDDLEEAARASASYLTLLNRRYGIGSLAEVGECWNGGHPMENPGPAVTGYVQRLIAAYQVPILPALPAQGAGNGQAVG